ncbi:hypothetical protein [Brachybacterium huguangmaarense]
MNNDLRDTLNAISPGEMAESAFDQRGDALLAALTTPGGSEPRRRPTGRAAAAMRNAYGRRAEHPAGSGAAEALRSYYRPTPNTSEEDNR